MAKWRVGIIGAGAIAQHGHIPGYQSVDDAEVVAICDVNEARAQEVAADKGITRSYTDYREMLDKEKLDVVSVCSPNAFHAEMAIAGLESGANVLCEKPMALTYADACRMVETSKRMGKSLTVGFHNRYRADMRAGWEVATSGSWARYTMPRPACCGAAAFLDMVAGLPTRTWPAAAR